MNANVGKELVRAGMIDLRAQPVSDMRNFQFQAIVTLMRYTSHSLEIDQREYGEHILIVPPTPKPFAAAHAIHLLFCAPGLVEEVEE